MVKQQLGAPRRQIALGGRAKMLDGSSARTNFFILHAAQAGLVQRRVSQNQAFSASHHGIFPATFVAGCKR